MSFTLDGHDTQHPGGYNQPGMKGDTQLRYLDGRIDGEGVAHFLLDGARLGLKTLDSALGRRVRVEIADEVWKRIDASFEAVQRIVNREAPAYGINTGFGRLCQTRIPREQVATLQTNLILSHAVGVGTSAPAEMVRWMLLFKLHALTHGVSGVSRKTILCLAGLLQHDLLPVIPTQGSLGASGDLAPLAHMVLPMIGRGRVTVNGDELPADEALGRFNIEPVRLGPKEGLALINGTQFMSAYGAAIVVRAQRLVRQADINAAMSLEGFMGSVRPFDERLHQLRPHPGAQHAARNMRHLTADSEIQKAHADCDRVQDPYSFRCIPQVHGASRDALDHAAGVIETEINSVTDNPLIFENDEVISGGGFHGQPLALVLDYLAIALAELASISERRTQQLLMGMADLPVLLIPEAGLNSGYMVSHCTAAALVSENKGLCTPASVDSIPTSLGQEDHVSMGARCAVKCLQVLANTETVLAIELMCAAQALDFRAPLQPGTGVRLAHAEVRKHVTHADADRMFGDDIQTSLELIRSQAVLKAVEQELGSLM